MLGPPTHKGTVYVTYYYYYYYYYYYSLTCGHWNALYKVTTKAEVGRLARMFFSRMTT